MRWRQGGFTLVELVVVLLIITACVTVVFPNFSDGLLRQQRLEKSVCKIAGVAEYAHQRAVSTHLIHILHISIEQSKYWVTAHTAEGKFVPIGGGLNLTGRLPAGVYFTGIETADKRISSEKVVTIEFSPQGWIEPVTIYVASLEGRKMGIVIHEMSGTVEMLEVFE
ncbi:MAG: prepilin-type N-terminal cleavage/methylation domain-containing protein [Sedimentisphaerales bacterium]|nr:prepilin-type N-terminal cleavage/methylation domain-containing protein [Sedimentisphaerales bacterium]